VKETIPILQPEKENPFWQLLLDELANSYEGKLELIFPNELNKHYFSWFHSIEDTGFRRELQYSFEELKTALIKSDLVFWFLTMDGKPQIIVLGYSIPDESKKSFYLDTFAVKPRGKGIGNIVIKFLIRWAKTKKYHSIMLDTELKNEKGMPLQQFYAQHEFKTISASGKEDIVMKRIL
jgi:GNAT superfamily N-acetyltransferase